LGREGGRAIPNRSERNKSSAWRKRETWGKRGHVNSQGEKEKSFGKREGVTKENLKLLSPREDFAASASKSENSK